jgi:hypothetical protein
MKVIYALQELPKSIFLAGPTPRDANTPSWRPRALSLLEDAIGFDGTVLVPETEGWDAHDQYDTQVHWEWEALNLATVVVFWVPRDLETMPAFTTNIEFGLLAKSGKVVFGYPDGAPKMKYLEKLAKSFNIPVFETMLETLEYAVHKANRTFGE